MCVRTHMLRMQFTPWWDDLLRSTHPLFCPKIAVKKQCCFQDEAVSPVSKTQSREGEEGSYGSPNQECRRGSHQSFENPDFLKGVPILLQKHREYNSPAKWPWASSGLMALKQELLTVHLWWQRATTLPQDTRTAHSTVSFLCAMFYLLWDSHPGLCLSLVYLPTDFTPTVKRQVNAYHHFDTKNTSPSVPSSPFRDYWQFQGKASSSLSWTVSAAS